MAWATISRWRQCEIRLSDVGEALASGPGQAGCVHHGQLIAQGQVGVLHTPTCPSAALFGWNGELDHTFTHTSTDMVLYCIASKQYI